MKNTKFLSVLMVIIMLLMTMTSCLNGGGSNDVKVDCTISVIAGDVFILDQYPYEAVGEGETAPTVLNAVEGLLLYNDIAYITDGGRFDSICDVEGTVYEHGANNYFWLCTINGEEMKGRADKVEVKPGDVIVYEYTLVEPE